MAAIDSKLVLLTQTFVGEIAAFLYTYKIVTNSPAKYMFLY